MQGSRTGAAFGADGPTAAGRPALGSVPVSGDGRSRLEEMRRHLSAASPASGNEALRILRAAFPDAPLAERVRAAEGIDRYAF